MEEIIKYKCSDCGRLFETMEQCIWHECRHESIKKANEMLRAGNTLQEINNKCKIWDSIPEHLQNIRKNNCFAISYLQGCDKPAYKIHRINMDGRVYLWGCGSWSGYYGKDISLADDDLLDPRPKNELFIDPRYEKRTKLCNTN